MTDKTDSQNTALLPCTTTPSQGLEGSGSAASSSSPSNATPCDLELEFLGEQAMSPDDLRSMKAAQARYRLEMLDSTAGEFLKMYQRERHFALQLAQECKARDALGSAAD